MRSSKYRAECFNITFVSLTFPLINNILNADHDSFAYWGFAAYFVMYMIYEYMATTCTEKTKFNFLWLENTPN
jgi:hypothetical protein